MTLRGLILWMYCTYCMCIHTLANACLSVFAGGHYCSPERVGKRDWDLFIFDSKEGVSYREFVITTEEKESWSTSVGLFLLLSVGHPSSTCTMYTVCIACPCSAPLVRFHFGAAFVLMARTSLVPHYNTTICNGKAKMWNLYQGTYARTGARMPGIQVQRRSYHRQLKIEAEQPMRGRSGYDEMMPALSTGVMNIAFLAGVVDV